MKLKEIYNRTVKAGIEADVRSKTDIENILKEQNKDYNKLSDKQKQAFDIESLSNPFADTRILNGNPGADIKSMIIGIDVEGPELVLVDRLKDKGIKIDLALAHHPEGKAFANFYEVMDLQADVFAATGISISASENLLGERKVQVARRVHSANHQRSVDIARLLGINFMCIHTPADNFAYQYINKMIKHQKPKTLGQVMDLLCSIPEYKDAAKNNNPPIIAIGSKKGRVSKVHLEFTGGTEGPEDIYDKLAASGVDTIIAMHQSETHYKKCKAANINVIFASHIASDVLGLNLLLDKVIGKEKIKIYEFSGFRRFKHGK